MDKIFGEGPLLNHSLEEVDWKEALEGADLVLIYFSAHWCGPCQAFTPKLSELYKEKGERRVEVVFASSDLNQEEFQSYYGSMAPWLAFPYNDERVTELKTLFDVSGIPWLVALNPRTGAIIENEADGKLHGPRQEQLRALDFWTREATN